MSRALDKIMSKETLSEQEAQHLVMEMMEGAVTQEEMAAVLAILQFRGETVDELVGFAKGMKQKSIQISLPFEVMDTCGTGGDGSSTYNISTAVAILLSSMGVNVAKHGNRSVSSKTGSADVLEELGIPFQKNEKEAEDMLRKHHLTFLFAQTYHSAMKNVAPVRKKLAMKTIFNLLGPLTNPAGASHRIIGVYDVEAARKMAEASRRLGIQRALFVCGEDGLDEITIQGKTTVIEVNQGTIKEYTISPEDLGLSTNDIDGAIVETPQESAALIQAIFQEKAPEAARDLLLLNAGAGLYVQGAVSSMSEGVHAARKALGEPVMKHLEALQMEKEASNT
ncbi:anthranilate phosphoribosyltransferase [Salipaludibacillus neizhouensis]|uniref:Anthranilate phosphoribosyltransferase n=1 Tax=Salipaludibacillus neizhouensis TaxID=885475 RepID=A0A3A9K389_9BACI|nr:anthranilate phosphoribosyltransferase [Salipaludibacillus neizhouensis]RKL67584.1 anthranilate phosphoribosyltransferase [Salipaludibacillus neizhouensis]